MSQYENHHLENSPLPFIYNFSSVTQTNHMFGSSNWHENIEIIHITEGDGIISINGQILPVSPDDIVVINSNQLHALSAEKDTMHYRYLIVDRSFCLLNGFDSNLLSYKTKLRDSHITALSDSLHAAYDTAEDTAYRTLSIRCLVSQIMLLLCRDYSQPFERTERFDRGATYTKKAIDYINAAYDKDFSLEDVADFVGISKFYLSHEFHKYTGYPFVGYVNRVRCKKAQQLLADEHLEIKEISSLCGFENASYFARAFRRYIGISPAEYRALILKTKTKRS